jgi:hypothetical protein
MSVHSLEVANPLRTASIGVREAFAASSSPASAVLERRNTALDWVFYDVGNLTSAEFSWLSAETNREGSILIVWPSGAKGEVGVRKLRITRRCGCNPAGC